MGESNNSGTFPSVMDVPSVTGLRKQFPGVDLKPSPLLLVGIQEQTLAFDFQGIRGASTKVVFKYHMPKKLFLSRRGHCPVRDRNSVLNM